MFGMLNQNVHRTFWLKVPKGQRTNCERKELRCLFEHVVFAAPTASFYFGGYIEAFFGGLLGCH